MVTVGIAQLVEHGALDAANKGFVAGMASKGFKENENVKYDRQNAQADQSNLQNIAQRFVGNKVDLILRYRYADGSDDGERYERYTHCSDGGYRL